MTDKTSSIIPLIETSAKQLHRIRRQLEAIFRYLEIARDEVAVCSTAAREEGIPEVATVLSLSICNRLHGQMKSLTNVIERRRGRTQFTEDREEDARIDEEIR
jgi:hypothetical protein